MASPNGLPPSRPRAPNPTPPAARPKLLLPAPRGTVPRRSRATAPSRPRASRAMAEPRMRPRQKGQQFATADLEAYLFAFGDDPNPLSETVKVLDEVVTDFIIETCHEAAQVASYSRRAKIKVDDFKFLLRKDPKKLGRVTELLNLDKEFKKKRKAFDVDEAQIGKVEAGREDKDKEDGKDGKRAESEGKETEGGGQQRPKKRARSGKGAA